jgi:sugar-specific transcriptional regulator TrmB
MTWAVDEVKKQAHEVLTELGLTTTQARVYFSLCQVGISTANAISKESGIARQDIYRVLTELEEMDFVEKTITKPVMFEPVPLEETIDVMMKERAKKSSELQTKTHELVQSFVAKKTRLIAEEPQFVLIPKGRAILQKGKETLRATQDSMDCVTSYKRFLQMMFTISGDVFETLNRGVKFRFILDKPDDTRMQLPKNVEDFRKASSCSIRYISHPPQALIAIYDKREAHIVTSLYPDFNGASMLWSNNPSIVGIIKYYFETIWFNQSEAFESFEENSAQNF